MDDVEVKRKEGYLEEHVITTQEKIAELIKNNIYDIVIVLICIVYMFQGVAQMEKTGDTLVEIFGKCFINLLFSLTLCRLLEGRGLMKGGNGMEYQEALTQYYESVKNAGKYITKLDEWCSKWTRDEYKRKATTMLYRLGISYEQFVEGNYDIAKFSPEQLKQLDKVKRLKIAPLKTEQLMSGDLDSEKQIDYTKITKKKYMKMSTFGDLTSKVLMFSILGYFTLSPITTWDWSGLIWSAFQAALALGLSVLKYFNAYNFMTSEMRAKILDKTHKLNLFIQEIGAEKNGNE